MERICSLLIAPSLYNSLRKSLRMERSTALGKNVSINHDRTRLNNGASGSCEIVITIPFSVLFSPSGTKRTPLLSKQAVG